MNYIRGVQYKIRLPKFAIWKGRKNGLDIEVIKGILYIVFVISAETYIKKAKPKHMLAVFLVFLNIPNMRKLMLFYINFYEYPYDCLIICIFV